MSMFYDEENNILRFDVPNSEANINAQHFGIVDRTVGAYYMSERFDLCLEFLNNFEGDFFIDIALTYENSKKIISILTDRKYNNAFKNGLIPQNNNIEIFKWLLEDGMYFYKTKNPSVNNNKKYLKFDNCDNVMTAFKTLILGDLCSLFIKKIGRDGYVIYMDKSPNFNEILNSNRILKWMK